MFKGNVETSDDELTEILNLFIDNFPLALTKIFNAHFSKLTTKDKIIAKAYSILNCGGKSKPFSKKWINRLENLVITEKIKDHHNKDVYCVSMFKNNNYTIRGEAALIMPLSTKRGKVYLLVFGHGEHKRIIVISGHSIERISQRGKDFVPNYIPDRVVVVFKTLVKAMGEIVDKGEYTLSTYVEEGLFLGKYTSIDVMDCCYYKTFISNDMFNEEQKKQRGSLIFSPIEIASID